MTAWTTQAIQVAVLHAGAVAVHLGCFVYGLIVLSEYDSVKPTELFFARYDYRYYEIAPGYWLPWKSNTWWFPSPALMHTIVSGLTTASHAYQIGMIAKGTYGPLNGPTPIRANPIRWVEYAITATLMTLANTSASGILPIELAVCVLAMGIAQQLMGHLLEISRGQRGQQRVFAVVGWLLQFGTGILLVYRTFSSRPPQDDVQLMLTVSYAVFYGLFGLLCISDTFQWTIPCGGKSPPPIFPNYWKVDALYVVLSITSKQSLFWLALGDARDRFMEDNNLAMPDTWVLGVLFPGVLLVALSILIWQLPGSLKTNVQYSRVF